MILHIVHFLWVLFRNGQFMEVFLVGGFIFCLFCWSFIPKLARRCFFGWQKHAKTATNLVLLGPGSLCRPLLASGFNAAELEPFSPARFSGEATAALGPRCFVFFCFFIGQICKRWLHIRSYKSWVSWSKATKFLVEGSLFKIQSSKGQIIHKKCVPAWLEEVPRSLGN